LYSLSYDPTTFEANTLIIKPPLRFLNQYDTINYTAMAFFIIQKNIYVIYLRIQFIIVKNKNVDIKLSAHDAFLE
jgi:hypothetical protein